MLKSEEIEEMCRMFGSIPDPDSYPITFEYYVQMYHYFKQRKRNQDERSER